MPCPFCSQESVFVEIISHSDEELLALYRERMERNLIAFSDWLLKCGMPESVAKHLTEQYRELHPRWLVQED